MFTSAQDLDKTPEWHFWTAYSVRCMLKQNISAGPRADTPDWVAWLDAQLRSPGAGSKAPQSDEIMSPWPAPTGSPNALLGGDDSRAPQTSWRRQPSKQTLSRVCAAGIVAALLGFVLLSADLPSRSFALRSAVKKTRLAHTVGFETVLDNVGRRRTLSGHADLERQLTEFDSAGAGQAVDLGQAADVGQAVGADVAGYLNVKDDVLLVNSSIGSSGADTPTWTKLNLSGSAQSPVSIIGSVGNGMHEDPLGALALVADARGVREVGGDTVLDGVKATHFRFQVGTAVALQSAGVAPADMLRALPKSVTYEVWVDANNYVRQVEFVLSGDSGTIHYAAHFVDIDKTSPVVLPQNLITEFAS